MLTELAKFANVPNLHAHAWIDTEGQHVAIEFNKGKNDGKPESRIAFAPDVVDYLTNWLKGTNAALGVARFSEQLEMHSFNEDQEHEIEDEGESHYVKVFIMCDESVLPKLILKGLNISETKR